MNTQPASKTSNLVYETFTAENGITFGVRLIYKGDYYGLRFMLKNEERKVLVEFYDTRYPHTIFGQFISRYYASTLLEGPVTGLNLQGNVPNWSIDAGTMDKINQFILKNL